MPSVVLISGTSTGIGRLTAEAVARAGHFVYATMRGRTSHNSGAAQTLEGLAAKQKLPLKTLDMDVCSTDSVQRAVDIVLKEQGRIDVAVNNAGLMSIGLAEGFTEEQLLHQMNVNFMGSFRVSRAVLPHLREHLRRVVIRLVDPDLRGELEQQRDERGDLQRHVGIAGRPDRLDQVGDDGIVRLQRRAVRGRDGEKHAAQPAEPGPGGERL